MEREVIVVGAGPGGATAAMTLAQQGYDVLLLDRTEFPRDKACGDGIPAGAIELLYSLGMEEKIREANFYSVDKLRLVSPKGHTMDADLEEKHLRAKSAIVPRLKFDHLLKEHAVASGAEFVQARVKEPIIEEGQVRGVRAQVNGSLKEIRSRVVVAADGVTSTIARALRPDEHRDEHRAVALRAYVEDLQELPHQVEFYLYDEILPGYAWIFPIAEGCANIGLGMRLDSFREEGHNLNQMLDRFMEMPDIKKRIKNGGSVRDVAIWQLSFGSQKNIQRAYDGAILVGDAAGLINPLTGGGINNAIISAYLAGKTIHAAFLQEDFSRETLQVYDTYFKNTMWPSLSRSYTMQRVLNTFPFFVDFIVKRARQNSEFAQTFMTKL